MTKPNPYVPASFSCQLCGAECPRKSRRGQIPKWCGQRCADLGKKGRSRTCDRCGKDYFGLGVQFCSVGCAAVITATAGPSLGRSYAACDWSTIAQLVRDKSTQADSGCWLWNGSVNRGGYPTVKARGGSLLMHRLALEASLGAKLGTQAAHHTCATRRCVNPVHLQPVTHAENMGEMLARRAYRSRIRDLEAALSAVAPSHPLLAVVPTA